MHDLNYPKSSVESDAWLVAFVAMGFYVPREFLYDMQYLRWRIEAPSEIEIYNKNLDYYLAVSYTHLDVYKRQHCDF